MDISWFDPACFPASCTWTPAPSVEITVDFLTAHILSKPGAAGRTQATLIAVQRGSATGQKRSQIGNFRRAFRTCGAMRGQRECVRVES